MKPRAPLGADLVIPAMALTFAIYFFFSIADLAWEAKANGVVIGAVLLTLVAVQLVRIGLRVYRGEADLGMKPLVEPLEALPKRIGLVLVTVAFIATMQWLGVTLGLVLALAASLWILGVRNRKALILVPLGVGAAVYLMFVAALQSDIPHGPVELLLTKLFFVSWQFLLDQFATQFGLWWVIWPAILLGIVVGILPGFSPQNTLIMLLPLTLAVPVEQAMAFMIALYCANHLAGGIPAILVRIPGSGGAAATTLDGYPMTQKGQAQQALVLCFTASVFGGLITTLATIALLPWLSQIGLYLRSVEMVIVMLFGLTLIAVIAAKDTLKGLIAGFFGLLIGVIGTDHIYNTPRATFGFLELYDGVPLVPALIGLFAISEALVMIEQKMIVDQAGRERALQARWADTVEGLRMSLQKWWHIVWTAFVGLFIGIVPGAGASIAAFVAYQQSRLWSKHPELYGTGVPEGVIAPESANNGVTSGTLVPTLALGVPGGSTAAVMMIVLQYHGMVMGPRLFATDPGVAYGVFVSMAVAYIFMIFTILPLARYMSRVVLFETSYLAPIIILVTIVAAFGERQYLFDMGLALVFGVIGYIAHKTNYHVTALLIGILLGPLFEQYLVRSLRLSEGNLLVFFSSPLGNVLWALLALSLVLPFWRSWRMRKATAATQFGEER